jgi:predicted RNA-binding protein (virulence factor B family)
VGVPFTGYNDLTLGSSGAAALAVVAFCACVHGARSLVAGIPKAGLLPMGALPLCHSLWLSSTDEGLFCLLTGRAERRLGKVTVSTMLVSMVAVTA